MDDILATADRLWRGEVTTAELHPVGAHRAASSRSPTASRSARASRTRRPSRPTTGWSWSTPGRRSSHRCSTTRSAGGPPPGSTPRSSATATSTTSSAWASSRHEARRQGVGAAARGRPRAPAGALRPLPAHRGLQPDHQPAPVRLQGPRLADRVPLPRRDLLDRARPRRRRHRAPPAPREGRDRRPHRDVDPAREGAVLRRPVHLGEPERGQPPEGPALPRRVGGGAAPDGRPRRPSCCCPGHGLPVVGAGPRPRRRSPTPRGTSRPRRPDRSR